MTEGALTTLEYSGVSWDTKTTFKGRNGYCNCIGLDVMSYDENVRITAINSRHEGISCWMEIPINKRLDVCLAILPELEDLLRMVPKEKLPVLIGTSLESLIERRVKGERK